jgi:DNA-binding helix-hairpin-helix protein with protein kinase domain
VASVAAFVTIYNLADRSAGINEIRIRKDTATSEWSRMQSEWQARAGSQSFDAKRSELERLKHEWDQLPNVRLRKLDELKAHHRQLQREEFLDGFEIERATIPGIGPSRKQTLSSYGIETAADIKENEIAKVPGFGPVLCSKLIEWRESVKARFRFDPNRKIDPRHIAKLNRTFFQKRSGLKRGFGPVP